MGKLIELGRSIGRALGIAVSPVLPARPSRRARRAIVLVEACEPRLLMSATYALADGILSVNPDAADSHIEFKTASGTNQVFNDAVSTSTPVYTTTIAVAAVAIAAGTGTTQLDFSDGWASVLSVTPQTGSAVDVNIGTASITLTDSITLDALSLNAGALLTVASGGDKVITTNTLAIDAADGALLDINNNTLIVQAPGTDPNAAFRTLIGDGFGTNWDWTGTSGITSSAAAHDPAFTTSVGYVLRTDLGVSTFVGQTLSTDAMVVQYAISGDINLDGVVNGSDYSVVLSSYIANETNGRWAIGDFTYDGLVNGDDLNGYFASGASLIHGTTGDDTLTVSKDTSGNFLLTLNSNAPLTLDSLSSLTFLGGAGNNSVVIDESNGDPLAGVSLTLSNATLNLESSESLGDLTIGAGSKVTIAPGGDKVLNVNTLSIDAANDGLLDVNDDTLIVQSPPSESTFAAWLSAGYAGGAWTGTGGITSTASRIDASHASGSGYATTLELGNPTSFEGQTLSSSAVVVQYTLKGDTNMDGAVSFSDLGYLLGNYGDAGWWAQGDSNYDGSVGFPDLGDILANYDSAAVVRGGSGDDVLTISIDGDGDQQIDLNGTNVATNITNLIFLGGGGNNTVTIDETNGDPLSGMQLNLANAQMTITDSTDLASLTLGADAEVDLATGGTTDLTIGTLSTDPAAVLTLNDSAATITTLQGTGAIALGTGSLTLDSDADLSLDATLTGSGTLAKTGTGSLTLTADNSGFSGALSIAAGTLITTGPLDISTLTGSGTLSLGSQTLTLSDDANSEFDGTLSGTGSIFKAGTGAWTLTGTSGFSGTLDVAHGLLVNNGIFGSAAFAVEDDGAYSGSGTAGSVGSSLLAVSAQATSGTGALINWTNDGSAAQFIVTATTGGVTSTVGYAGSTDSGMQVTGLTPSTVYVFNVFGYNSSGSQTENNGTSTVTTNAAGGSGVYEVTLPDVNSTTGLSNVHSVDDSHASTEGFALVNGGTTMDVVAGSEGEAVRMALAGHVNIIGSTTNYTALSGELAFGDYFDSGFDTDQALVFVHSFDDGDGGAPDYVAVAVTKVADFSVSVQADQPVATRDTLTPATFLITRSGDASLAGTVYFHMDSANTSQNYVLTGQGSGALATLSSTNYSYYFAAGEVSAHVILTTTSGGTYTGDSVLTLDSASNANGAQDVGDAVGSNGGEVFGYGSAVGGTTTMPAVAATATTMPTSPVLMIASTAVGQKSMTSSINGIGAYYRNWVIKSGTLGGVIIQKVSITSFVVTDADTGTKIKLGDAGTTIVANHYPYWEGWTVSPGGTSPLESGLSRTGAVYDDAVGLTRNAFTTITSGKIAFQVETDFYEGQSMPPGFKPGNAGGAPESGSLQSSTTDPGMILGTGTPIIQTITLEWVNGGKPTITVK